MDFNEAKKAINGFITWQRALNKLAEVLEAAELAQRTLSETGKKAEDLAKSLPSLEEAHQRLTEKQSNLTADYEAAKTVADAELNQWVADKKVALQATLDDYKEIIEREMVKAKKALEAANDKAKAAERKAVDAETRAQDAENRLAQAEDAYNKFKANL